MTTEEANLYYNWIKYCPECGKCLERNPISGWLSCFLHGDFVIAESLVVWEFTKNLIVRK